MIGKLIGKSVAFLFKPVHTKAGRALAIAALAVSLAGCGAVMVQNPSSSLKPVNATADAQSGEPLMLKGADVVAYWTMSKYVQGKPEIKSDYEGVTFRFSSAEHKALFDKEPKKYLPEFGGYCADGLVYAIPWGGDADTWSMLNGKLYIFGGQSSKDAFELNVPRNLELSTKYWNEEVAGNNSFFQRMKRLTFKVPHYKSGGDLAKEVAEAKAKK